MLGNRKHEICIGEARSRLAAALHGSRRLAAAWHRWFPPGEAVDDLCTVSINAVMPLLMLCTPAKDNGLLPLNVLSCGHSRSTLSGDFKHRKLLVSLPLPPQAPAVSSRSNPEALRRRGCSPGSCAQAG